VDPSSTFARWQIEALACSRLAILAASATTLSATAAPFALAAAAAFSTLTLCWTCLTALSAGTLSATWLLAFIVRAGSVFVWHVSHLLSTIRLSYISLFTVVSISLVGLPFPDGISITHPTLPTATPSAAAPHGITSASNSQCLAGDQSFANDMTGRGQNPAIRLPRYLHEASCRFLVQALEITQSNRLHLFNRQLHFSSDRYTLRDKGGDGWITGNKSCFFGSRHRFNLFMMMKSKQSRKY